MKKNNIITGLFAFDGPMYKDCNGIYCNTTITNEMLERYFCVVDKLYLLIRTFTLKVPYQETKLSKLNLGERIEVIEIPNLNSPIQFLSKHKYAARFATLVENTDLIFLRIPSIISDLVAKICKRLNKPYLAEVGGCSWDSYFNHGILGKMVAPIMYINQKKTVHEASFASYVTEQWLQKRYPTRGQQIAASNVYLKEFNDTLIEARITKVLDHNYRPKKIGTIASIDVRYKGQEYIIRALQKLKQVGYKLDYELVGVGEGKYLKALAKKCGVEDQVHFLGLKKHNEIWTWLDSIDIYAQPSKQEGLPRALIEAMNRGCICIGSTTAGIPELLDQAFIFRNGDVNKICEIIKNIYFNSHLESNIRRNYTISKKFAVDILNKRRTILFKSYAEFALSKKTINQPIKNLYSISDKIQLAYWLVRTKLLCHKARLIRFPIVTRGKRYIDFGTALTTGVGCRLETFVIDNNKHKRIIFGNHVQINDYVHISAINNVTIGDHTLIASHVYISDNSHGSYAGNANDTSPLIPPIERQYMVKPVQIGKNVWIGEGVIIMPGTSIGDGCVIGAHSIVTQNIPANCIAVGAPAKIIKQYSFTTQRWERLHL